MNKVELNIIALAKSKSSIGNFSLILEECKGFRRLAITVGHFEAQAIAIYLEKMQPNRPMTHDLFMNTLKLAEVEIKEVIISDIVDGIFYAELRGIKQDGTALIVDARSSDAIAMAIRFECPIYTSEQIMQNEAVILDSPSKAFTNKRGKLSDYSMDELQHLLNQVLAKEDYESASKIKSAIEEKRSRG